jgi:hypothetical protein
MEPSIFKRSSRSLSKSFLIRQNPKPPPLLSRCSREFDVKISDLGLGRIGFGNEVPNETGASKLPEKFPRGPVQCRSKMLFLNPESPTFV